MSEWSPVLTLIVPTSLVDTARTLALKFPGAAGMWTTPLASSDGPGYPAVAYISSGKIWQQFYEMLTSPAALAAATGLPLANATAILSACIVSETEAFEVMEANNLQIAEFLNANSCDRKDLIACPEIGEVKADAIISARPWTSVDALLSSQKLSSALRNWITV